MTTDVDTQLFWDFGVDLSDFKRDMGSVAGELKTIGAAFGQFAKQADAGFSAVVDEIKGMATAFQTVRGEGVAVGREVNAMLKGVQRQVEAVDKAIRQADMTKWEKAADNYAASIKKATAQVELLKDKLNAANVTEKQRMTIQGKIAEGEANITRLLEQSKVRVDQIRVAEEKRLKALKANTQEMRAAFQDLGMMAGAMGAAIVGGFGFAGKKFADLSDQLAAFRAVAKATDSDVANLVETAKGLDGIKTTAAAAAAVALGRAGLSAREATAQLERFGNAALVAGESMDLVSSLILGANRAWGLSNSELGKTTDIMVAAANASATSVTEVGHAVSIMGSTANATNQSLLSAAKVFGVLRDANVSAEMAATGYKNALNDMAATSKQGSAAMDRLFKTTDAAKKIFQDGKGELREWSDIMVDLKAKTDGLSSAKKIKILSEIFDERARNVVLAYLGQTEEKIKSTSDEVDKFNGITERSAKIMKESFGHQIRALQKDFEDLQISIAEDVLPMLKAMVSGAKEVIEFFDRIPQSYKLIIEYTALAAGAILTAFAGTAGIVFVVGRGLDAFKVLAGFMKVQFVTSATVAAGAQTGFNASLMAGVGATKAFLIAWTPAIALFGSVALAIMGLIEHVKNLNQEMLNFDSIDASRVETGQVRARTSGAYDRLKAKLDSGLKGTEKDFMDAAHEISQRATKASDPNKKAELEDVARIFRDMAKDAKNAAESTDEIKDNLTDADTRTDLEKLKAKLDLDLAALDNEKKKIDAANEASKAISLEAKSVDELSASIGQTALAFANDRDQSIAFQKRTQSIGLTCAATVNEILRLAGVTKDLSSIIGNVNWVPNYDKLIDLGYAVKVAVKDLQAGDIVSGYERKPGSDRGHIGVAIGGGKVVHASSAAGGRAGLRQLATVDTIQGGFGHIRESHGGQTYGIRLTEKAYQSGMVSQEMAQIASEEGYYKRRIALLQKYEGAYLQAMAKMTTGTKEYDAANTELLSVQGKIAESEKELGKLGVDTAKMRQKASEDHLKIVQKELQEVLGEIKRAYSEIQSESERLIEGVREKTKDAEDDNANAALSKFERLARAREEELKAISTQADKYRAKMADIQDDLNAFKQHGALLSKEQQKESQKLQAEYGKVKLALDSLGASLEDLAAKRRATSGIAGAFAGGDDGATNEFYETDRITASTEATREFLKQFQQVKKDVPDTRNQMGRMADTWGQNIKQTETLTDRVRKWAKENGYLQENIDRLTASVERLNEAQNPTQGKSDKKGPLSMDSQPVVDAIGQVGDAFRGAADIVGMFSRDVGGAFSRIGDYASKAGAAISTVFKGDPGSVAAGAMDGFKNNLFQILSIFTDMQGVLQRILFDMARLNQSQRMSGEIDLEAQIVAAEREGRDPVDLKKRLAIARGENRIKSRLDSFNAAYGTSIDYSNGELSGLQDANIGSDRLAAAKADMADILNEIKQVNQNVQQEINAMADKAEELVSRRLDGHIKFFEQINKNEALQASVEDFFEKFDDNGEILTDGIREKLTPVVEAIEREKQEMLDSIASDNGGLFDASVMDEYNARLTAKLPEFKRKIAAALAEARKKDSEDAKKQAEQDIKDAEARQKQTEDDLRKRVDSLKRARADQYNQDAKAIQGLIDAEERKLKVIEDQAKALQAQIDLKNKERQDALSAFDSQDLIQFGKAKSGIDYEAMLRQGLDDIANIEGAPNSTFSTQSLDEAIKARVDALTLQAENMFGLEEFNPNDPIDNQKQYLEQIKLVAAFQAKAVSESLKREGLTSKQRDELRRQEREAYQRYQEAVRQQINITADAEIVALEGQISRNNADAESHRLTIEAKKADLTSLRERYDADLALIDERINAVLAAHDAWTVSAAALKNGIAGPLNEIIGLYNNVKAAIQGAVAEASKPISYSPTPVSGGGGGITYSPTPTTGGGATQVGSSSYNPYGSSGGSGQKTGGGATTVGSSSYNPYGKMATGGVVPPGFPNDSYPALLSSNEPVFPTWFADLLERTYRLNMGNSPPTTGGQRVVNINMNGVYNEPGMVKREILEALRQADYQGSIVNGPYFGNLN